MSAASEQQQPPPIRKDLEIVPQYYRGELSYVAKDPVSLSYYRLGEIEYVVLKSFQQGMSVEETQHAVKEQTGAEVSSREVYKFVEQLKGSNLLKSKSMADVRRLSQQQRMQKRGRIKQLVSNYLFITIPVWDPDTVLNKLLPYFRMILRPTLFLAWLALSLTALWIIITNFSTLVANAFSLLSGWNLLILSGVVFSIKLFHEMGHALTCKHFGGEVHAIGPAFLVFQPCMFTDTSDAWLFPSKWDRIAVTSAGIIVEIMMASIAAIVWISSEPGMVKQVAYTMMVACSISTLLFNANPLLRFDGYYILSDLLEIPNMRVKTVNYLGYLFDRYLLGIQKSPPPMNEGDEWTYLTYGVARFVYRIFIVFSIGLFLYSLFEPLGVFMWATTVYGMILAPIWKRGKELARHYRFGAVRTRYILIIVLVFAALAGTWFIPIDYTIQAPVVVAPSGMSVVRTGARGKVEKILVKEGEKVEEGQLLVQMSNPDLRHRAEQTRAKIREVEAKLRSALAEDAAAYQIQLKEKKKLQERLEELEKKLKRLELRAPTDGMVVDLHQQEINANSSIHQFVQNPHQDSKASLDRLEGTWMNSGTGLLGVAAKGDLRFEAFAYEHDISSLSPGLDMKCMLRNCPNRTFKTNISEIVPVDVKKIENVGITLADVGYIPVKPSQEGGGSQKPLVTLYVVRGRVGMKECKASLGQTGKARIQYGSGPLGSFYFHRLVRAIKLRMQEV
mgnify:CR=1 FL=1